MPGHKYSGPGNQQDDGESVDEDDWIARRHDRAHAADTREEDAFSADREAVGEFGKDSASRGSWHSLVGAGGLGAKRLSEKYVVGHPVYGMPGRKRERDDANGESDAGGRSARRRAGPEVEGREDATPTAGGGSASAAVTGRGGFGREAGIGSDSTNVDRGV